MVGYPAGGKLALFVQHAPAHVPQGVTHPVPPGTGFVLPRSCTCTMHHNSLPINDLSLAWLRWELGLFVQEVPPPLRRKLEV